MNYPEKLLCVFCSMLLALLLLLFRPVNAHAQLSSASVTGTVRDTSGAVIADAHIILIETSTDTT